MIGGELPHPRHRAASIGAPALVVDALDARADDPFGTTLRAISFTVHAGEIVGIAGVSGNGQKELLAALSGERTLGRGVRSRKARAAILAQLLDRGAVIHRLQKEVRV